MDKLMVVLHDRRKVEIDVETLVGNFAVHPVVYQGKAQGPGYTVTHVHLGCQLWTVKEYSDALKVARWFDEHGPIPRDAEGAARWRQNLHTDGRAYTLLIEQLMELAPRYYS